MATDGGEEMSVFQRSLLQRLNTMQKSEERPRPPTRNQTSGQKTVGSGGSTGSFIEELQMKRKAVVQKGNMGGRSQPGRDSTASGTSRGDTLERRGVASERNGPRAPGPPQAPKRNFGNPKVSAKPTIPDGANESTGSNTTRNKAAPAPIKPKPNKPAKLEKPSTICVPEKPVRGSSVSKEPSRSVQEVVPVNSSLPKEPVVNEPMYVNTADARDAYNEAVNDASGEPSQGNNEVGGDTRGGHTPPSSLAGDADGAKRQPQPVKKRHSLRESSKPLPGGTNPPPAPKRTKSVRPTRRTEVNAGANSGYNSGTSGDGVVVRNRKSKASNQGASGNRAISPMGSTDESDYSGDGKVHRSVF